MFISNIEKTTKGEWYKDVVEGTDFEFKIRPISWLECEDNNSERKIFKTLMYSVTGWRNLVSGEGENKESIEFTISNRTHIYNLYEGIAAAVYLKACKITGEFRKNQIQEDKEIKN